MTEATGAASGEMQGMICLRGQVPLIADLSRRMGRELNLNDSTRILVVEANGTAVGLIVDTMDEVLMILADQIEAIPLLREGAWRRDRQARRPAEHGWPPERALGAAIAA